MAYLHIENLYRPEAQDILAFKEVYALEKVHGTSAHVAFRDGQLHFFSGGESHTRFVDLFNEPSVQPTLLERFLKVGHPDITVYGEAYGGKCQGMSKTYGGELRFIAFDVMIGDKWLNVTDAVAVVEALGLEFVPYRKVPTDIIVLDAERDRPSEVAVRRWLEVPEHAAGKLSDGTLVFPPELPREGVVLRPPFEVTKNNGARIIVKHKGAAFNERATVQKVVDPAKLAVLAEVDAIVNEWVVPHRLDHVLDHLRASHGGFKPSTPQETGAVIKAMVEDVLREAKGEIVESKAVVAAIGKRTAQMFKQRITQITPAE
jgi:hypothetical protein